MLGATHPIRICNRMGLRVLFELSDADISLNRVMGFGVGT